MAKARREMEGEIVAALTVRIPLALLDPKKLSGVDLNPFRDRPAESEAMRAHKAKLAAMRFKAMAMGSV